MILNGGTYNGGYAAGMGGGGLVGGGSAGRVGGGGAFGGSLAGGRGWGGANGAVGARGGGGACGCDDGCDGGGCGAGCGPGYDTTGVLSYVGAGGDYKQETTFTYVGQGAGDFEMVAVPSNIRSNICVCIIPLILLLLLVPLLLYLLPQLSAEPYDCKAPGVWSPDQNAWCCQHYAVGCPTPAPLPPPPAPAPLPPPPAPAPVPPPPPPPPLHLRAPRRRVRLIATLGTTSGRCSGSRDGRVPRSSIAAGRRGGGAPPSCRHLPACLQVAFRVSPTWAPTTATPDTIHAFIA